MKVKYIISKNIRGIRKARGLSQKRLAELSKIDVWQFSRYKNHPDDVVYLDDPTVCKWKLYIG